MIKQQQKIKLKFIWQNEKKKIIDEMLPELKYQSEEVK